MSSYYTIGTPEHIRTGAGDSFYLRVDTYHTDSPFAADLDGGKNAFHCTDLHDLTPRHERQTGDSGEGGDRCYMCYAGYGHTDAYHARSVASYERNRAEEQTR